MSQLSITNAAPSASMKCCEYCKQPFTVKMTLFPASARRAEFWRPASLRFCSTSCRSKTYYCKARRKSATVETTMNEMEQSLSVVNKYCERCKKPFTRKSIFVQTSHGGHLRRPAQRFCSGACRKQGYFDSREQPYVSAFYPVCGCTRTVRYVSKTKTGKCKKCMVGSAEHLAMRIAGSKRAAEERRRIQALQKTASCGTCEIEKPNTKEYFQFKTDGFLLHGQCRSCKNEKVLKRLRSSQGRAVSSSRRATVVNPIRQSMYDNLGHVCSCCGESEKRFLTLEHLNGGGNLARRQYGNVGSLAAAMLEGWPKDKYTVLCYNCNMGKHKNKGICPHKDTAGLTSGVKSMTTHRSNIEMDSSDALAAFQRLSDVQGGVIQ